MFSDLAMLALDLGGTSLFDSKQPIRGEPEWVFGLIAACPMLE
jgi:hypothetical protein